MGPGLPLSKFLSKLSINPCSAEVLRVRSQEIPNDQRYAIMTSKNTKLYDWARHIYASRRANVIVCAKKPVWRKSIGS